MMKEWISSLRHKGRTNLFRGYMRIIFIGDVMGRSGREALATHLPVLKESFKPDLIIVNGENAAHGRGITTKFCKEFYDLGVDVITTGNHVWDQREILSYINNDKTLLRPLNYPDSTPGQGIVKVTAANGQRAVIINVMGRLFMDVLDDPFRVVKEALIHERLGQTAAAIFIDFHGEATSEKMSFAHHFDGQVSAVVGTHTHVPTADAHILSGGTAYPSDVGMTGPYDSGIGVEKDVAIHRFVKKFPGPKIQPATGEGTLCGVLVDTNDQTGLAVRIEPNRLGGVLTNIMPV